MKWLFLLAGIGAIVLVFRTPSPPLPEDQEIHQHDLEGSRENLFRDEELHEGMKQIMKSREKKREPVEEAPEDFHPDDLSYGNEEVYPEDSDFSTPEDKENMAYELESELHFEEQHLQELQQKNVPAEELEILQQKIEEKKQRLDNLRR